MFQLVDVGADGVGEIGKLERKQIGGGEAHDGGPGRLGESATGHEIGVGKMRVPENIVVDGMIAATTAAFTAEAEVQRCDAQVIDESSVIGSGAERANPKVGSGTDLRFAIGRGASDAIELGALPHG